MNSDHIHKEKNTFIASISNSNLKKEIFNDIEYYAHEVTSICELWQLTRDNIYSIIVNIKCQNIIRDYNKIKYRKTIMLKLH